MGERVPLLHPLQGEQGRGSPFPPLTFHVGFPTLGWFMKTAVGLFAREEVLPRGGQKGNSFNRRGLSSEGYPGHNVGDLV